MPLPVLQDYLARRISPGEDYESLLSFPRYLEIETVNVCNARCPMCTIGDWERGHRPMTDDLFKRIAAEVIEHRSEIKRVSLYRDGEPLIDKKMPARIKMLKDGGVKNVGISTNVSLLNEERSHALLEAGIDTIIFSIDSLVKEVYEAIRLRLKFEEVMENAHRFLELRNKINPSTKVWVRMIRQESNQDEWPVYQKYWSKYVGPNDRIYYHNIFNWGGQLKDYTPISKSYEPSLPCVALWSLMVILCNGDVPLCNIDYNNKYPTGSVLNSTIAQLWQSKVMNERRELHLTGKKSCIDLCTNCNVWDESPDLDGVSAEYAAEAV